MLRALKEHSTSVGFTLDDDGSLVLGIAIPIKSRNIIYGVGVYLVDAIKLAQGLVAKDGGQVFISGIEGDLQTETETGLYKSILPDLPDPSHYYLETFSLGDVTYSVAIQSLYDKSGEPLAYLGSVHDITEEHAVSQRQEWLLILAAVGVLAVAIVVLKFIVERSLSALDVAVDKLDSLAQGNLNLEPESEERKDEIGKLRSALGATVNKLKSIVGNIEVGSDEVVSHSEQLSMLAQKNTDTTDEQKKRIDQVTVAVTQMDVAFQELASNICQISDYCHETQNGSKESIGRLDSLTHQMQDIANDAHGLDAQITDLRGRSESISKIVEVIKGVAEQTNLLALNAAIEAARAGEHGRGFAVVADEVRNLSKNTQESIVQIEEVVAAIQQSTFRVSESVSVNKDSAKVGADLSQQAASSLNVIDDRVKLLQDRIYSCTSVTEEMAASTAAITHDVEGVSVMTESVLNDVQKVSESADALQNLAHNMQQDVLYFSVSQR